MRSSTENLLALIRSAFGVGENSSNGELLRGLSVGDWQELIGLSFEQGVAAIAVDGLSKVEGLGLRVEGLDLLDSPELEDLKYEWFGEVFAREEEYNFSQNWLPYREKVVPLH